MALTNTHDSAAIVETAVAYKAKQCCLNLRIPEENIRVDTLHDFMRDDLLVQVGLMMAGVQDKTQTFTNTKTLGFLPSTFGDWVKKLVKDQASKCGWHKLAQRFDYKQTAITTNHVTEHWNVCPHTPIHDRRDGCLRFMRFGSDFKEMHESARIAAQQIVKAVIADVDSPYAPYPSVPLLRAIRDYKEATGCR